MLTDQQMMVVSQLFTSLGHVHHCRQVLSSTYRRLLVVSIALGGHAMAKLLKSRVVPQQQYVEIEKYRNCRSLLANLGLAG